MKARYLIITLIAAGLPLAGLIAEDSANKEPTQKDEQNVSMAQGSKMMCKSWSQQDAELDQLVVDMKNAAADKKVDAVAAVVAKLVEQRKAAHDEMAKMMNADEKSGMKMCRMMMGMDMKSDEQMQNGQGHSHHH